MSLSQRQDVIKHPDRSPTTTRRLVRRCITTTTVARNLGLNQELDLQYTIEV